MLPYITVFSHRVAMYGVMAALGAVLAVLYLRRAERHFPQTAADAELVFVYGMIGMFVGAKLLSLLTVLPELRALPVRQVLPELRVLRSKFRVSFPPPRRRFSAPPASKAVRRIRCRRKRAG